MNTLGDVTMPTQVIKYNQISSRRISQSDCSIQIKLNYINIYLPTLLTMYTDMSFPV
jgi:hypothetical protein